jgi:L-rhamnose-H+ transport protein
MSPNPFLGVVLHALGGFAAGSFYIPYKKVRGWAWETYWLVGGFISWIIVPWIVGLLTCPNLLGVLRSASGKTVLWTYLFGVMWGIGGLTFGLSMRYLGLSLGMALSLGFCAVFGTLIPPVFGGKIAGLVATTSGRIVILGIIVCLTGIAMCGRAGMRKEKELSDTEKKASIAEFSFVKGVWVAVFAGIMSSCLAFAFAAGKPIAEAAVASGARPIFQNFPVLVVALFGGFTTNFVWCVALSVKNRSGRDYLRAKMILPSKDDIVGLLKPAPSLLANYAWSALAGTTWYFQFFFYGMGTTQMGRYDFSSWTIHMAFIITFSSLWGIYFLEWKGTGRPTRRLVVAGIAVLILSTVVIGAGNYVAARAVAAEPVVAPAEELAVLETSMGAMAFELFPEDAPKTVAQFKDLVRQGFYDGKDFYRVVRGHVIQTGGGEAPKLPPEFNARPHAFGTLGLGRTGDEWSGDSEFYVCVAARPYLDGKYTVFGRLVEGAAVLEKIAVVPVEERWEGPGRMAMHKPVEPVVIKKARMEPRGAARPGGDGSLAPIRGLTVRYFYQDPAAAERFYGGTLGLPTAGPGLFRLSKTACLRIAPAGDAGLDAASPKTATLSFVTDEVDGWYAYLRAAGLAMRSELKDASRHPTRGFVTVDPEGYLLEFERFLDDPRNSRLLDALAKVEPLGPAGEGTAVRPKDLRIKANILWLYYQDLEAARLFAIDKLSAGLLVDQGFAKVMTASPTGFIGLVDGAQGLHPFTERKAVRIDLLADDPAAWVPILKRRGVVAAPEGEAAAFADAGGYVFRFVGSRDTTPITR